MSKMNRAQCSLKCDFTGPLDEDRAAIQTIRDQIRRGLACYVKFTHVTETESGWSTPDQLIVGFTPLPEDDRVLIYLLSPNPSYAEFECPFQPFYLADLGEWGFVDEEVIDAIADHIIDHQMRYSNPCENHPDERCTDCHLRVAPCFGEGGKYEA
jgi:hypothetical protein